MFWNHNVTEFKKNVIFFYFYYDYDFGYVMVPNHFQDIMFRFQNVSFRKR